jgi:putative tryptophan/tyrosine transport system substrate-binding protein
MNKKIILLALCSMLLAPCSAVEAQQAAKAPRIGYLSLAAKASPRDEAFVKQLRDLGWVDGQSIYIEYRWAANKPENLAALADELVNMKVDVIAAAATPAVQAAKNATKTIPIVMISVADAVGSGFVASLAQPGGNITGTTNILPELAGKRLDLLKEVFPKLSRIAFMAYGPVPCSPAVCEGCPGRCPEFEDRVSAAGIKERG